MIIENIITKLFFYWREILSLGLLGGFGYVYANRPKVINENIEIEYIDDSTSIKWIEKNYEILWGPIPFLNTLYLCKTIQSSKIEICCSPAGDYINSLPDNTYLEKSIKKYKKIYLIDKRYYKNNDIREIKIIMNYPVSKEYRDKIKTDIMSDVLIIKNENRIMVKNYVYVLKELKYLNNLSKHHNLIDLMIFEFTTPNFLISYDKKISEITGDLVTVKTYVNEIPPTIGGTLGELSIPLS